MPKKKVPRNAFYFFMIEYKMKEEKKGKYFKGGMNQVSSEAGPIWQQMTDAEKSVYKKMEKNTKGKSNEVKLTSQGVPVSMIEKQEKENQAKEREMKKKIQEIVQNSILNNALGQQKYYFIAANYFCKTREDFYHAAEIALSEFSLQEGILNKFHSFINPGNLPLGMTFTAREYSDKTHQLPIPPHAMGEANFPKLLKELVEFIADDAVEELPPLFTTRVNIPIIKSVISQLCVDASEDKSLFRIYPLEELFFVLKKAAAQHGQDQEGFPSIHVAQAALDRDQYECQSGIACEHHDDLDIGKYCSLSLVSRWGFLFADHICLDLAISLIPGRHVPPGSDTAMASFASFDTQAWRSKTDTYDEESLDGYDKPDDTATESKLDDDDTDLTFKDENPWAVRSKKVPRLPAKDALKFGRGTARSSASTSSNVPGKSMKSHGRGQLLDYE